MAEQATEINKDLLDEGLEKGIEGLTPEKIQQTIMTMLKKEGGAKLSAYSKMCVHCALCFDACHFCLSHDRDADYAPAGKVARTILPMIKNKGKVDKDFLKEAAKVAFTECNLCKRCVMYCPFGIDVAYMMLFVRRTLSKLGVVPMYIQDTAHSHSVSMNQMWVKGDEWIDTLFWQEEEAQDEIDGLRIPIDKVGADVFYSVIGPEPKFRAQLIYQAAVIMNVAGIDWTMPSGVGWDNSDMAMYCGENELMGRLKNCHFEAAAKLKAKRIVMGECGHAFRSVYDMGNRWLGYKTPPVEVVHAVDFYHELFEKGLIKIAKKFEEPVTFHDPCNIVRGRGLHEKAREVVRECCETFIEMTPNREHNYCCSAGGGVINCGPPHKPTRVRGNRVKAEQLFAVKARGAKTVIAPCHNCHGGLEDIIHDYGLGMELKFLGDIIYECMEKPEACP